MDTRNKRFSIGQNAFLLVLPLADGTIDASDRFHFNLTYSATGSLAPVVEDAGTGGWLYRRRRARRRNA